MLLSADPQNFDYDVFLSYDRQDAERVHRLAERLRDAGLRVWLDDWILQSQDYAPRAIERGLQASRVLVLCLSPAAVASDWLRLERMSVLFRDPSRVDRRFVPLLLKECDAPEAVRRFRSVDYRGEKAEAFAELVAACRNELVSDEGAASGTLDETSDPLAVLERKLEGHSGWVNSVAVSPDGRWAVSGSEDKTVKVWDLESGECQATLTGHRAGVNSVAITPDSKLILSGSDDKKIRVWQASSGHLIRTIGGHRGSGDLCLRS